MRTIAVATWVLLVASHGLLTRYCGVHWSVPRGDGLVFLSDITRPAFLVDLRAVQRACAIQRQEATTATSDMDESSISIPPILLPQSKNVLVPFPMSGGATSDATTVPPHIFDRTLDPVDILHMEGEGSGGDICFGYIHCQVVKPLQSNNDATFLCQLNLNSTVFAQENHSTATSTAPAHLVLGLNNHHVISYYWARSAGSGSAMEAPGVIVVVNNNHTATPSVQLRWASPEGYTACNSNDGKRSEWVPFLNVNDQVQLRPNNIEMVLRSEALRDSIYGVTMLGRPLGSEPVVVCQWNISAFV